MYTEEEVKGLLKMQIKKCADIACMDFGNHVGKAVGKTEIIPLVKLKESEVSEEEIKRAASEWYEKARFRSSRIADVYSFVDGIKWRQSKLNNK